jgi:hypothetical protein
MLARSRRNSAASLAEAVRFQVAPPDSNESAVPVNTAGLRHADRRRRRARARPHAPDVQADDQQDPAIQDDAQFVHQ